ncbi:hypothetical protein GQ600_17033 [Phytophthora cactorum]|nr:hypothetical protein GQ600_17033 [Phytophthora cactorum]
MLNSVGVANTRCQLARRVAEAALVTPTRDLREEDAGHLFANEIKSDGYSASVLYYRPKHEELGGEDNSLVLEGYSPDVVIGLDPGMRSVCTAAREYLRLQAPRRRSRRKVRRPRRKNRKKGRSKRKLRRKRNFPKWIRRAKRARHRNNRDIVSVTTREYRHLTGFNRFRAWNESQKRKFPDYKSVIEGMPSFKTSSYEKLTCVAYGDWSRRDDIKGHAPSPVKELKEALRKRDGGFHGRVQDEQALLAVPPVTFQRAVSDSGLPQGRLETQDEEDEGKSPPSRLVAG